MLLSESLCVIPFQFGNKSGCIGTGPYKFESCLTKNCRCVGQFAKNSVVVSELFCYFFILQPRRGDRPLSRGKSIVIKLFLYVTKMKSVESTWQKDPF